MSTRVRTTPLVIGLALLSTLTMAQNGSSADKATNQEHHSRLAKAALWRHHKDASKNVQQGQAKQVPSKADQANTAQLKPGSGKQVTANRDQKQQHDSKISKSSAGKAVANKAKPQEKAQPKPVSLKQ